MKTSLLLAATALLAVAAAPAFAAMDRIGSVDVNFRSDRDVESMRFGGPVERLSFRAERSDVDCRSIRATFDNGQNQQIYSGQLRQGADVSVDLPGNARNVRTLQFNCGAQDRSGGTIQISADVGQYQSAWRNSPDWGRVWSSMFNWTNDVANNMGRGRGRGNDNVRWEPLSTASFRDTVVSFDSWRGRSINAIALMPVETDARCSRVNVNFQNGRAAYLSVNNGGVMRRGQTYALDLPGGDRNIRSITLNCQSENSSQVTIRVLASR